MWLNFKLINLKVSLLLIIWSKLSESTLNISKSGIPDAHKSTLPVTSSRDISPSSKALHLDDFHGLESVEGSHFPKPASTPIQNKWFQDGIRRSSSKSGWFGFNHFIPRSARNMAMGLDRTALLGEGTQIYPMMMPPFPFMNLNPNPFHQQLHELQQSYFPRPQNFLESQMVIIEQPPPESFLVPVYRPRQPSFSVNHPVRVKNLQQPKVNLQQASSAPTPVTIKIVPLKITSFDIANVLKAMSWVPINLDVMKGDKTQKENGNDDRTYHDSRPVFDEEDESNLPPPSSHVATPLGITYAENRRSPRYENRFSNRN